MGLSSEMRAKILQFQLNEITEYHIYTRLAQAVKSPENRAVLQRIGEDERRHYEEWKDHTQT